MKTLATIFSMFILVSSGVGQVSLSLELVQEHGDNPADTSLIGLNTYRLYVEFDNPNDVLRVVFGKDDYPMEIRTSNGIWQHALGGMTATNVNPLFFDFIPGLEFDSYLTTGYEPSNFSPFILALGAEEFDEFEAGNDFVIDNAIGGGLHSEIVDPDDELLFLEGRFLIAQITTSENLWGTVNIDYIQDYVLFGGYQEYVAVYGLTFGSPDQMIFGCTDSEALNYNPDANVLSLCTYQPGDFDGDNDVDITDLLDFITNIGCVENCGAYDIDGDGVVSIFDLLALLGLL